MKKNNFYPHIKIAATMKLSLSIFLASAIVFTCFTTFTLQAQSDSSFVKPTPPTPPQRLRYNLNQDGSRYFQVTFLNQVWLRYNQSNAGTTVNREAQGETFDIGLRRTRMQMFGQITDRVFLYFQYGMNNFNAFNNQNSDNTADSTSGAANNRKYAAFFHDAFCEYQVFSDRKLVLGTGLTIANGLSRFSQPSIGTIMTMDVPVFLQATVDQTDEFSRKLSVVARGQIGKIDYRFSLSDPFPINNNGTRPAALNQYATFARKGHSLQYQGFVQYQIFDKEPHTTPYMTGTFLGDKKIFNIAAGAIYQPKAMWRKEANSTDTSYQDMLLLGIESYLDIPLNKEKGTAISAFAGFFDYHFGDNYLRYNGIMNPATGSLDAVQRQNVGNTYGNAYPMMGTGQTFYFQIGYLMPKSILGEKGGRLLPYASWQGSNWQRLNTNRMDVFNIGCNWLIDGHKAKISINYENRPTYQIDSGGAFEAAGRRGAIIFQYQIFI
jgi:hypothetical protein